MTEFDRLPPGFRLLCLAARPRRAVPDEAIAACAAAIGDWSQVVAGATSHHVVPLVADLALRPGAAAMPAAVRNDLIGRRDRQVRRCLRQTAELIRLTQAMEASGIRCLALKGVALSQRIHGDPSRRGLGDIDLLVDPLRFDAARTLLAGLGYALDDPRVAASGIERSATAVRDLAFRHAHGHLLELHQRLTQDESLLPFSFETLWQGRRTVPGWTWPVFTLSAEHEGLYLLVHGAEHGWTRLRWIADLAPLFQDEPLYRAAQAQAAALDLGPGITDARILCRHLLEAPSPAGEAEKSRAVIKRHHRWFVAETAWVRPPAPDQVNWYQMRELRLRWGRYTLRRTWKGAASCLLADLSEPVDWHLFNLPPVLRWLYPLLRPLGWLIRRYRARRQPEPVRAGRGGKVPRD
ncbi:nucleotidyltransferase domain-containing protein [Paramagnetospirillum magneticum]|uniref:Nucleotidyltransferase family protein n=1 Tax=Paramagnetospirillum magneticum (strain ATCC 700264 / AMB-1) TaxID=342108 RepID=Q2W7B9_PARM1|nr:nucleotidyltransferase family protein [Paramagnetospirillum magneticum]BAE50256.1 hypothetical protein amb1452 [Paramagnetospirillum magneticum AMB-1]